MEEGKALAHQDSTVPLASALAIPVADADVRQESAAATSPPLHPATTGFLESVATPSAAAKNAAHNKDPTVQQPPPLVMSSPPPVRDSNAATVALACGIASIVCALVGFTLLVPFVFASVVLGPIAICHGKKANREGGNGTAGIITGIVGTVISGIAIATTLVFLVIAFGSYY